ENAGPLLGHRAATRVAGNIAVGDADPGVRPVVPVALDVLRQAEDGAAEAGVCADRRGDVAAELALIDVELGAEHGDAAARFGLVAVEAANVEGANGVVFHRQGAAFRGRGTRGPVAQRAVIDERAIAA